MPPSPPTPPERERERERQRDRDRDRDRDRHQSASASASVSAPAPASASAAAPSPSPSPTPSASAPAPVSAPHESLCEDGGQLENLNEKQLRALLDEAVTYKRPKDREGKSSLFKNLLYKAEQASEEELQLACSSIGSIGGANCGKRGRAKRSLTHFPHSGSLQDLAGAGSGADVRLPRPHARHRRPVPVSARSLHGGSLPANVDQQYFSEDVHCGTSVGIKPRISGNDYIATVKCINPPPLGEPNSDYMVLSVATDESDRVSSPPARHLAANSPQPTYISGYFDDDEGTEMDYIRPQKNSHVPSYTSRTTLEIVSPSMTGDAAADRNSNSLNLVDTNHGCITSPAISQTPPSSVLETKPLQLPSSYCAVRSVTGSTSVDGNSPTNSATSGAFPVIPNTHLNVINIIQSQSHQFQHESDKKNFDENYNAVQNIGSITGTREPNQKNQKKRKKLYKNETQTLAELIDGYRGDEKLDDIIKFIESDADNVNKHHGKNQSKSNTGIGINGKVASIRDNKSKDDNDHDKSGKKRSTERRVKDKLETKLKRANSMEELSRRKIDDLTSPKDSLSFRKNKKTCVFESASVSNGKNNERRSWCSDESEPYSKTDNRNHDSDEQITTDDLTVSTSNITVAKHKKTKPAQTEVDISIVDYDPFYAVETSDFQTVTKKKKIRKRHSPSDEGRNKSNFYSHNVQNMRPLNGGRSNQERDTLYKRFGNGPHPSVSSPPSDKSNDSNDDLDSVHSLPADASGERFQASYADMARAAPPVSPPPSAPPVSRQHNFPDLIESCNYYTNDVTIQDKHFDISVENTKNLLLKENTIEYDKTKSIKGNCLDLGNQPDLNTHHKAYIREQYPALESRQKICNKITVVNRSKVDSKFQNHRIYSEKHGDESAKPFESKNRDETATSGSFTIVGAEDAVSERYVDYRAVNSVTENMVGGNHFVNAKPNNKLNHLNNKIDNPSKPPDVVLPLAEINQSFESRPPVIIMNEEPNRSSDDIQNINGITFGFDINEQLINGEIAQASDSVEYSVDSSTITTVAATSPITTINNNSVQVNDSPSAIVYNSNVDFPAINEKPFRDSSDKSKVVSDDSKHSKKSSRVTNVKDGIKFVSKSNCLDATVDPPCPKAEDANDKVIQGEGQVVETCVGGDKALRYLAPTATSKDIYNLDRIVHYVGMAWENIIKSSGDKIRYFSDQQ